jgi:hypothetical protein
MDHHCLDVNHVEPVGSRTVRKNFFSPAECRGRCKVGTGAEEDKRVLKGLQLALQGKAANFSIGNLFSVLHMQPFDNQVRSSLFPSPIDVIEADSIALGPVGGWQPITVSLSCSQPTKGALCGCSSKSLARKAQGTN